MKDLKLVFQNLEEIITPEELENLLRSKKPIRHYIGFEISGLVHLGTGLMTGIIIRNLQRVGVKCQVLLADFHSYINDKLGGDLKKIQKIARSYFQKALELSFSATGANPEKINFILGSELYHHNDKYWESIIKIAKHTTLNRILRSIDIMGRKEKDIVDFAKLIYPVMQVADIFTLKVDIAHGGMDQRKAHVIARDVAEKIGFKPPVALHHHLLLGGQKPPKYPLTQEEIKELGIELKMSKSKPETSIFVHDSPSEIETKVMKVFCPPKDTLYNPVLDWTIHLILPIKGEIKIKNKIYEEKNELIQDYKQELIHPLDLKESFIKELTEIIKPIYNYFCNKKILQEL